MSMGGVQIAVVDASKISLAREGAPEPEDFSEVAKELCSAFQETGFAYLVNHGVDLHLVQQVEGNLYILVWHWKRCGGIEWCTLHLRPWKSPWSSFLFMRGWKRRWEKAQSIRCFQLNEVWNSNDKMPQKPEGNPKKIYRSWNQYQWPFIVKGWVAQGREIFDQDEGGNIAELEVGQSWTNAHLLNRTHKTRSQTSKLR